MESITPTFALIVDLYHWLEVHTAPLDPLDSTREVSHTNSPIPYFLPWPHRQVQHPIPPQVRQWLSILRIVWATATVEGVDAALISSRKLLCFSNDGLERVSTGPSVNPQRHLKQKLASMAKAQTQTGVSSTFIQYISWKLSHMFYSAVFK